MSISIISSVRDIVSNIEGKISEAKKEYINNICNSIFDDETASNAMEMYEALDNEDFDTLFDLLPESNNELFNLYKDFYKSGLKAGKFVKDNLSGFGLLKKIFAYTPAGIMTNAIKNLDEEKN